jgi:hypothetical protein
MVAGVGYPPTTNHLVSGWVVGTSIPGTTSHVLECVMGKSRYPPSVGVVRAGCACREPSTLVTTSTGYSASWIACSHHSCLSLSPSSHNWGFEARRDLKMVAIITWRERERERERERIVGCTWMLGSTNTSCFYHVFKRWTPVTTSIGWGVLYEPPPQG